MDNWLRPTLRTLSITNALSDCTVTVHDAEGKISYPCHKLVFSCASKVFEYMLYGRDKNMLGPVQVCVGNVERSTFELCREYIYCYDRSCFITETNDQIFKLLDFAYIYRIDSLKRDCCTEMMLRMDGMNGDDLLKLFAVSHVICDDRIATLAVDTLYKKYKSFMDSGRVYEFDPSTFAHYMYLTFGLLSEPSRFHIIELYLQINTASPPQLVDSPEGTDTESETELETATVDGAEMPRPVQTQYKFWKEQQNGPKFTDSYLDDIRLLFGSEIEPLPIGDQESETDINENYIEMLLEFINFEKFSPKEFYNGPGASTLLTHKQKFEHLYKIAINMEQSEWNTNTKNSEDDTRSTYDSV